MTVIADPAGRLIWASAALPGSTHNLIAARTHGITCALTSADVMTFADMGYQGAGGSVRTRVQAAPAPAPPAEGGQPVPRPDPRPRRASDRPLKTWKILAKVRCCPRRAAVVTSNDGPWMSTVVRLDHWRFSPS